MLYVYTYYIHFIYIYTYVDEGLAEGNLIAPRTSPERAGICDHLPAGHFPVAFLCIGAALW